MTCLSRMFRAFSSAAQGSNASAGAVHGVFDRTARRVRRTSVPRVARRRTGAAPRAAQ